MTKYQRIVFWSVAIVCALTRFLARAASLWDWDEVLFCLGMRSYDVAQHHPHPPGFPLFIGFAKLIRPFVSSDFRALQSLSLLAGVLVFPAVWLLARELGMRFETAVIAGALCAFFPNVWFFGGSAFSDVPSVVLVVFAAAMLFRGVRSANAYLIGTMLLAIAIGFRPQNLIIGLFPGALATWYRCRANWRDVVFAAVIGIVVVGGSFGAAMIATGSADRYLNAIRVHGDYISRVDSFHSPDRPALWSIFDRFFMKQYDAPVLSVLITIFVLISLFGTFRRRHHPTLYALAAFTPMFVLAWLMLDRFSISRFSIGYIPLFALLAADGIGRVAETVGRRFASMPQTTVVLESLIAGAFVVSFFLWTLPALAPVRNEMSPTVSAATGVSRLVDRTNQQLYVAVAMTPFMEYFQPRFPWRRVMDERAVPLSAEGKRPLLLSERDYYYPEGISWFREKGHLWSIARRHYFAVSLSQAQTAQFTTGWYPPERSESEEWRWMKGHSETLLEPSYGLTRLRLVFDIPAEVFGRHPTIVVRLNGRELERITPGDTHVERDYHIAANDQSLNKLELDTDRVTQPSDDARLVGLSLRFLAWGAD